MKRPALNGCEGSSVWIVLCGKSKSTWPGLMRYARSSRAGKSRSTSFSNRSWKSSPLESDAVSRFDVRTRFELDQRCLASKTHVPMGSSHPEKAWKGLQGHLQTSSCFRPIQVCAERTRLALCVHTKLDHYDRVGLP